jgi:hypothetical protein
LKSVAERQEVTNRLAKLPETALDGTVTFRLVVAAFSIVVAPSSSFGWKVAWPTQAWILQGATGAVENPVSVKVILAPAETDCVCDGAGDTS